MRTDFDRPPQKRNDSRLLMKGNTGIWLNNEFLAPLTSSFNCNRVTLTPNEFRQTPWGGRMFLGHFAVALAAKKAASKTSLGTLVLAAQFADMLWPLLLLLGIEQVRIVPGLLPVTPLDFTSYPISHSLVAQLGWGALLGITYFLARRDARSALLLGFLVPSHWLLDFIAHRPDMPIYPGGAKYGLGMWNSLPLTIVVEYALFAAGTAVYLSITRAKDRAGNLALWSLLGLLAALDAASLFGPPPPSVQALAWSAIAIWLTVPWAAWADGHRRSYPERSETPQS
jgi:hypothetical protein